MWEYGICCITVNSTLWWLYAAYHMKHESKTFWNKSTPYVLGVLSAFLHHGTCFPPGCIRNSPGMYGYLYLVWGGTHFILKHNICRNTLNTVQSHDFFLWQSCCLGDREGATKPVTISGLPDVVLYISHVGFTVLMEHFEKLIQYKPLIFLP